MIDKGATVVIGHHPHVLQGIERYQNGIILYSLGNFFFPDFVRTDGLKFRFPRESWTTAAVLCEMGASGVESYLTVPMKTDRGYRLRMLKGSNKNREVDYLFSLSKALNLAEYGSFWRAHHNRTVKKRRRQEELF